MKQNKIQEIRILVNDEEVLDAADMILAEKLERMNRHSKFCYTATEIAKTFGMEAPDLNSFLQDQGVIQKVHGHWQLTKNFQHMDLTAKRWKFEHDHDGRRRMKSTLVWTDRGRKFILDLARRG